MIRYILSVFLLFMIISCSTVEKNRPAAFSESQKPVVLPSGIKSVFPFPLLPVLRKSTKTVKDDIPEVFIFHRVAAGGNSLLPSFLPFPKLPEQKTAVVSPVERNSVRTEKSITTISPVPPVVHTEKVPSRKSQAAASAVSPAVTAVIPEKDVTVYRKDKIVLPLKNTGWIYMGSSPSEGISFTDKITSGNNDVFYFTAEKYGDFILSFQQQRISRTKNPEEKIHLSIREKKNNKKDHPPAVNKPIKKDAAESLDALIKEGKYKKAYDSFNRHEVLLKILEKGVSKRDIPSLAFYYNEIFKTNNSFDSLLNDDVMLARSIDAGKIFIKKGFIVQGVHLLEKCLPFNRGRSGNDALLFILGTVYQNENAVRNEKKAAFYYKELLDEYPASIYWDNAHKAYMFLKRRYIDVR